MIVIGLTGGIGSGKSTVAHMFAELGVPVIDTDVIAREIVEPGKPAYHAIIKQFGKSVLLTNQELDRAALRQLIFSDDTRRAALENILHPIILENVKTQLQQLSSDYCIVVIPLLVENGRYTMLDRVLVVDTTVEKQIARAAARDTTNKSTIEQIIAIQASREQRLAVADDVILNVQDLQTLRTATQQIHDKYMNLCKKTAELPSS